MSSQEVEDLVQDHYVRLRKEQDQFYVLFLQRKILDVDLNLEN